MKSSLLALALTAPLLSGCQCGTDRAPPGPLNEAPTIDAVSYPSFPPLGPDSAISVTAHDDEGLTSANVAFRYQMSFGLTGTEATFSVNASSLGEGFGSAVISVQDNESAWTERVLEGILVDLSPPVVKLSDAVVRRAADSDLWLWTADNFVLGDVAVSSGPVTQKYAFAQGYPETLGVAWDQSLVHFGTLVFPEGAQTLHVRATDAAGNVMEMDVDVVLDGTPPSAEIVSPLPGATLGGMVEIQATAADAGEGAVWIALSLGGTEIGTFSGPSAVVNVDASQFAPGATTLTAVAIDEVGNESAPVDIDVTIE